MSSFLFCVSFSPFVSVPTFLICICLQESWVSMDCSKKLYVGWALEKDLISASSKAFQKSFVFIRVCSWTQLSECLYKVSCQHHTTHIAMVWLRKLVVLRWVVWRKTCSSLRWSPGSFKRKKNSITCLSYYRSSRFWYIWKTWTRSWR